MLKKILINLILVVIIIFSFDFYFYIKNWNGKSLKGYINNIIFTMPVDKYFDRLYTKEYIDIDNVSVRQFRPDENIDSKLKPILYMGCSFTYGTSIGEDETVSRKTAELTNRPVYNRGGWAWGLDQLVYQLQREDLMTSMPEPEFLIYTFINDQMARLDKYKIEPQVKEFQPHYKKLNNKTLKLMKPNIFHHLVFIEHILYHKYYVIGKTDEEKQEIIKLYFNEAYKAMRKYWKNTKFVILLYPESSDYHIFELPCWKEMEDKFIIININELTNKKMENYRISNDDFHPKAQAWDIILDKLIDYLQIK